MQESLFDTGEADGLLKGRVRGELKSRSLTGLFKSQLERNKIKGEHVAIICGSTEITYQQLDELSWALAKQIQRAIGDGLTMVNPDGELLIGVCVPMSERVPLLIFSILKLGAAYLPLGSHLPEELLFNIIEKFGPIAVITDDNGPILGKYDAKQFEKWTKLLSVEQLWFSMQGSWGEGEGARRKTGRRKGTDGSGSLVELANDTEVRERPAYVTYTTGFHSEPCGVRIGHEAILNRCLWEWDTLPYSKYSVVTVTNTTSVDGFVACCSPLLAGATAQIFHRSAQYAMGNFVVSMQEKKVTRLHLIPSLLGPFLAVAERLGRGASEFERLAYVMCEGSTIIPVAAAVKFFEIFPKGKTLVGICGPPECAGGGIYVVLRKGKEVWKTTLHGQIVVGKVWDNTTIYILDAKRQPLRDGFQGEISISGSNIALGYVNGKEMGEGREFLHRVRDKKKKYPNVFITGMYGRIEWIHGSRSIVLEGRADNQLEVNGFQIRKEDLYGILNSVKGVEATLVLVYQPYMLDQAVVTFVEGSTSEENIVKALSTAMPVDSMPQIVVTKTFPRINTKVIAHELIRLYQERRELKFDGWQRMKLSKEMTDTIKILADGMFKFAGIRVETVINNLHANFYQLGGNSLNTLSVLLHLHRKGFHLTTYEFTNASSLLELADILSSRIARKDGGKRYGGSKEKERKALGMIGHPMLSGIQQCKGFELQVLHKVSRKNVIDILSTAYSERGTLERFNLVHADEFCVYFNTIWQQVVDQQVSIVAIRSTDRKIVGVSLNQDYFTPPTSYNKSKAVLSRIQYSHELKGSILGTIPHYKQSILEVCWIGTHESLTPSENVIVVTLMMMENVRLSKLDGYTSIFCSTSTSLLRELCLDVLDFELLNVHTPKYFELSQGFKPFCVAPESITTVSAWLVTGVLPPRSSSMKSSVSEGVQKDDKDETRDGGVSGGDDATGDAKKVEEGKSK